MLLDELLEFADATSVGTPNNTTVNCGDVIDIVGTEAALRSITGFDIGNGEPVYLVIQVTTAITSGGAATVSFKLASDSTATPSVDGTATVHWESDIIGKAALVAGYQLITPIPYGASAVYERYLGIQIQEHAGQALNGGAINAFLTKDAAHWKAYDAISL